MGYHDFNVAPQEAVIQYLAAFSRLFREARRLCAARDCDGILMIGYAANALHNIPDHMRYYPNWADTWYPRDGSWSAHFRDRGAPDEIICLWEGIFIPRRDKQELGLDEDLSNWEMPPPAAFSAFMELFSWACIEMRGLRSLQDYSIRPLVLNARNQSRLAEAQRYSLKRNSLGCAGASSRYDRALVFVRSRDVC